MEPEEMSMEPAEQSVEEEIMETAEEPMVAKPDDVLPGVSDLEQKLENQGQTIMHQLWGS